MQKCYLLMPRIFFITPFSEKLTHHDFFLNNRYWFITDIINLHCLHCTKEPADLEKFIRYVLFLTVTPCSHSSCIHKGLEIRRLQYLITKQLLLEKLKHVYQITCIVHSSSKICAILMSINSKQINYTIFTQWNTIQQ